MTKKEDTMDIVGEVQINNVRGYIVNQNYGVMTFEVQGVADREEIGFVENRSTYSKYLNDRMTLQLSGLTVPIWGEGHNLYPLEVFTAISENKLLPTLIGKLVKFLFGRGPRLYQEEVIGEGKDLKSVRIPVNSELSWQIMDWGDIWEDNGLPDYRE